MTVPTLVLIGGLDDWTPAVECRDLAAGRDNWGTSRQKGLGIPIKLVVYPGAYHAFDAISLKTPIQQLGHHLRIRPGGGGRSADAVREFLGATIGGKQQDRWPRG